MASTEVDQLAPGDEQLAPGAWHGVAAAAARGEPQQPCPSETQTVQQPQQQPQQQQQHWDVLPDTEPDGGPSWLQRTPAPGPASPAEHQQGQAQQQQQQQAQQAQQQGHDQAFDEPVPESWPRSQQPHLHLHLQSESVTQPLPPLPPPRQQQQQPAWDGPPDFDDAAAMEWEDELREQQEYEAYERELQQQQQQAQQQQRRPPPPARGGHQHEDLDDEFEALLQEQQQQQQHAPGGQQQRQEQQQAWAGRQPWRGAEPGGAPELDLNAELDLLDGSVHQQGGARCDVDLGAELDALFEDGARAGEPDAEPSSPAAAAAPTQLKPATLASLGGAGATSRSSAAAALAALEAAAVRPRLMAADVDGHAVTVTGSTGARVYCQLAARGSAVAGSGGGAGPWRGGGLLQQPIDDLLEQLAARRREEVVAEYEAAQEAAAQVERIMRGEEEVEQQPQQEQPQQPGEPSTRPHSAARGASPAPAPAPVQRQLWVDKHAPRSFLSLLSEPRTNREIAAWMARWNKRRGQPAASAQPQLGRQQQAPRPPPPQAGAQGFGRGARGAGGQQQQQGAPGAGRGRGAAAGGRGGPGGGRGDASGAAANGGNTIGRGFDLARYREIQAARAAAKVLLVVGPPGTGKTTLAHVIASHCGFRVVEINASDERTAASLSRRVLDVSQMAPVLDGSHRPPCIVLDELDGASGGTEGHSAVAALVQLITGEGGKRKRGRATKPGGGGAAKGAGLGVPVICTANDAFAPCLRPLRDVAAVYNFKPPAPDKLSARLAAIAAAEGLLVDRQALSLLVERSGCDVRTAINTLQLLARRHATAAGESQRSSGRRGPGGSAPIAISAAAVASSAVLGVKDVHASALGVLQELLTASGGGRTSLATRLQQLAAAQAAAAGAPGRAGRAPQPLGAAAAARLQQQEHYSLLLDLNDHELVMAALQEALTELVGVDVDLSCCSEALAVLSSADLLLAGGSASAAGRASWRYVPACLLAAVAAVRREAAGMLSAAGGVSVAWPRAQAECARAAAASRALLRSWRASAPAPAARQLCSGCDAVLDLAPGLTDLSRPAAVRAVNRTLLSGEEDRLLQHVVGVMCGYGLTYCFKADEADDACQDGRVLRPAPLWPAIDSLHRYAALPRGVARCAAGMARPGWQRVMPLMLRQLMGQLISHAAMARLEQARHAHALAQPQGDQPAGDGMRRSASPPAPAVAAGEGGARAAGRPAGGDGVAAAAPPAAAGGGSRAGGPLTAGPAPKRRKGCWLDAFKAKAGPKRKALTTAAGSEGGGKRPALEQAAAGASDGAAKAAAGGHDVLFKFNEGYTNAVKRPIRMAELMM